MRLYIIILSFIYINSFAQNTSEQFNDLKLKADKGDPKAQCAIALRYLFGHKGTPRDEAKAINWYSKAANQGYTIAQIGLGDCYMDGWGVLKNEAEAIKWYSKAANLGDSDAQRTLGDCYLNGKGVPKNKVDAMKWYCKSADQGNVTTQAMLGYFYATGEYSNGTNETFPKNEVNQIEAVKWWRKAAEQGDTQSQYYLGVCYAKGKGVPKDESEAVKWYLKSAEQGYPIAQLNLGLCYANGVGVPKNIVEAYAWSSLFYTVEGLGLLATYEILPSNLRSLNGVSDEDRFLPEKLKSQMTLAQREAGQKRFKELKPQIDAKIKARVDAVMAGFDAKN